MAGKYQKFRKNYCKTTVKPLQNQLKKHCKINCKNNWR